AGLLDPAALASFVKVLLLLLLAEGLELDDFSRLYILEGRTSALDLAEATVLVGAGVSGTEDRSSFCGPSIGPNTQLGLVGPKDEGGGGALKLFSSGAGAPIRGP